MTLKRGKLPSVAPKHIKTFDQYLKAPLPTPPSSFDYGNGISFPMACNDTLGDCTIAGLIHLQQIAYSIVGKSYIYPGDTAVRTEYLHLTGGTDTGLVETTVLNWAKNTGILGDKIFGWAPIADGDFTTMRAANYAFGALYLGCDPPQDAETQFPGDWTLEPGVHPGVGGHCVVDAGTRPGLWLPVTWGKEIAATWNWWKAYKLTAYVAIPQVFVDTNHTPLTNVDLSQLEADCQQEAEANAG